MNTDPALTIAVTVLAAICGGVGLLVVTLLRARRRDAQIFDLLATFGPVAERARSGTNRFPFGAAQLEAAHARWTTDWLEWERNHDAEYRQKSEAIEAELDRSTGVASQAARTRLETLERQKLARYQRRYEEYVQTSRALANLTGATGGANASP